MEKHLLKKEWGAYSQDDKNSRVVKIAFGSYGFGNYKVVVQVLDTTADAIIVRS